ncbi:hypothetical protein MZK49_19730 [Ensifer sesbaniae]|uniref:hypothetical protein n=1 Tax=Ensifer sesbaniae TaxID=1214071 RepID=UPI002000C145|nr:hypothetical protein [Ensifer sesbaniae]
MPGEITPEVKRYGCAANADDLELSPLERPAYLFPVTPEPLAEVPGIRIGCTAGLIGFVLGLQPLGDKIQVILLCYCKVHLAP